MGISFASFACSAVELHYSGSGHPEDRNILWVPTLNSEAAKMHFDRKEISHTQKNGARMNVVQAGIVWLACRDQVLETR